MRVAMLRKLGRRVRLSIHGEPQSETAIPQKPHERFREGSGIGCGNQKHGFIVNGDLGIASNPPPN